MVSRKVTAALTVDQWQLIQGLLAIERDRLKLALNVANAAELNWWHDIDAERLGFVDATQETLSKLPLD